MRSNNLVILRGNLGADPEVRALPGGDRVAKFSVATSATFRGPTGDKVERTDWHRVEAWGKTADYAQSYLHKGDTVIVMGAIKHDVVAGPTGTKTTFTSIRAHDLTGFGRRDRPPGASPPQPPRNGGMPLPVPEEDLPF